jgi:hypothetical protein
MLGILVSLSLMGGLLERREIGGKEGRGAAGKTPVFGLLKREG